MSQELLQNHNHMTNTHLLVQDFDYFEPASVEKAVALLNVYCEKAAVVAGGTHLFIMMKMDRESPEVVININKIPGLDEITVAETGELLIGARATIRDILKNPYIQTRYTALAQACSAFGSTQIQIMGTIGGNVCNGSPASDTIPALLAFDAQLILKSTGGERKTSLREFLLGPGKTDLRVGELLTTVVLPPPPTGMVSAYFKVSRVSADLAKASLGLAFVKDGEKIRDVRIAYGAVAPTVIRISRAEAILNEMPFSQEILESAAAAASEDISPIDDTRSTAWYRRQIAKVMLIDGVNQTWSRPDIEPEKFNSQSNPTPSSTNEFVGKGERREITLIVNGKNQCLHVFPNELLVNVLRERLELTGTKYGCGVGECSACTIMLNGKSVLSCLILAVEADGCQITTIEGLQKQDGTLDQLQEAILDHGAYQCGFCTPGIIMTVKGLFGEVETPGEQDIREYLKGNRCRCTGYTSIVRAIMSTVERRP